MLVVNGYSERWLRQGFPWVYPNEVAAGTASPGAVVRLRSGGGDDLGMAIADDGWIRARRFRADAGPVDAGVLGARLRAAVALRSTLGLGWPADQGSEASSTCFRLVNGENDDLPGIRVDIWGTSLVISLDSPSLVGLLDPLVSALNAALPGVRSVHAGWRPDSRDGRSWPPPPGLVSGVEPGTVVVSEHGLRYSVEPGAKKDVGLFPDQRDNRAWLAPHYAGARVLNLYCYTGAFSVHALANGAADVVSVDLSRPYLDALDGNLALNGLGGTERHTRLEEDSLKALDRFRRQGRVFDRIILDPPGHSHSGGTDWSGEQDYARLVAAAARVCVPGGWIIASSNLGSVSPRQFQGALIDGLRKAESTGRVIHTGGQAPDFPSALHFPEGSFLKFVVVEARR
ncbi:MAG: class I SAM-dependent rRNA methyltransferase [Myxococcales bacterium]|nr:class I SAM-dependent rRNA methyltransferase [Myxococcales bacterium]